MPERRRRSAYRGKIEDDSSRPTSPKPSENESQSPDVGSGVKRPSSSTVMAKGILKNVEKDVVAEEQTRKNRRTMNGGEKADAVKKVELSSRSVKERQTLADMGGSDIRGQRDGASIKVVQTEERKISKLSSRSSSHGASSKNHDEGTSSKHHEHRSDRHEKRMRDDKPEQQEKRSKTDTALANPVRPDDTQEVKPKSNGKQRATSMSQPPPQDAPSSSSIPPASSARFHEQVPADLPEPKRLQKLLELAIEAEQEEMSRQYTGKDQWISDAFDSISQSFTIDVESLTIDRMKRRAAAAAADAVARPAQTAYARGEEDPAQPNPINDARTTQELALRRTLEAFQQEERDWDRLISSAAAHSAGTAASAAAALAPLPPAGAAGGLPPGHPLLQELSVADRALLLDGAGSAGAAAAAELPELVAWARGLVEGGLGPARAAVMGLEERAGRAETAHRRLVSSLRRRALGTLNVNDPKRILRSVAGPA